MSFQKINKINKIMKNVILLVAVANAAQLKKSKNNEEVA